MTAEAFTPQTEHHNISEVNHEGPGSSRAAERIAADFLSQYEADPNMARQGWQGTPAGNFTDGVSAAINSDARNVPGLELVGNIANEQAISPLLANNGALFDNGSPSGNPGDIQPGNPGEGPKDTEPQCAEVPPPCKDGTIKPGDKEAMNDSVAQPGDGYIRVAARLLGTNNTDDPTVLEGSKELESLHPGDRHDGWLNLNEKVLTPDEISQARNNSDQYQVVNQILEKYEQKPDCGNGGT